MPFGCLALRDGRTYHSLSDITDKYEIGQVLKAKEFCELCLVKERLTNKVYVCKKFLKKDGKKVRKAAKNEIMILKMVNHPNILKLIDAFETRKEFYIIQELATGGDVFDWILDQGNYTERDAANVIRQVLEAVAYLHSLNIVHRNLKLENLMYYTENNHNKVVLRDFYLSRFENGSITEPCGTPEYLAPEVVARHRYGRPVDCWAIGVIMYMLLSGNPPFYDETEEENTDMHNRIIFCRIVAGDYEFDSPYWDDISPAAKELVCRLMEVDQMIRITAQDALFHEWIAGNGASEKNLKDGVCAQFEKNFAKAKWRKAIRVTTFMQRLRASELGSEMAKEGQRAVQADGKGSVQADGKGSEGISTDSGRGSTVCMSKEMMVENTLTEDQGNNEQEEDETAGLNSASEMSKSLAQTDSSTQTHEEEQVKVVEKKANVDISQKVATVSGQEKTEARQEPTCNMNTKSSECQRNKFITEKEATDKKVTADTPNRRRMAANLSLDQKLGQSAKTISPAFEKEQTVVNEEKTESTGKQERNAGSWCQTQLPETVAEGQIGTGTIGESSSAGGEKEGGIKDRSGKHVHGSYASMDSSSLGHRKTVHVQEQRDTSHSVCRNTFGNCPPYSVSGSAAYSDLQEGDDSADWKMDSVIEQIEKQMAAVLEKIEGDMPSLLEQIRDCPESLPRAKSAHSSPSVHHRSYQERFTPPPLPTTPRPPMPPLPHLSIPPPSYPPPNPPTQTQTHNQLATEQGDRDRQKNAARLTQSPRGGISGRGL